jgi:hypothetical protein
MQAIYEVRGNKVAHKAPIKDYEQKYGGHEELVSALINIMPNVLITEIWAYAKLPPKVPEEFVNEISQLMPNDLTLIIWEYVMCPVLDLCKFCRQPREEKNDSQVCTSCLDEGKEENSEDEVEDSCDVCFEVETYWGEVERDQCPFCKYNWYHPECATSWGRPNGHWVEHEVKRARMSEHNNGQREREVIVENFDEDPVYGFCNKYDCVIHYPYPSSLL